MFIAANTRQPATASSVSELAVYFEMVCLKILPSAWKLGFLRSGRNYDDLTKIC